MNFNLKLKKEPKTHEVLLTLAVTGDIMALNRSRYKNVYLQNF